MLRFIKCTTAAAKKKISSETVVDGRLNHNTQIQLFKTLVTLIYLIALHDFAGTEPPRGLEDVICILGGTLVRDSGH